MDTTLIVNLNNEWKQLDIYEDIPISVVIQQVDSTALDTRKSSYSKQFVIPNTNNNAIIFEHYYEVNGLEFNPLTKIECVVQYRGTDIFNGYLRLNAVIENPNYTDYEVYIMGDVGDFASEIRNLTLQDLNWTDLQHELSYSAITTSWNADETYTNGLFGGKILYPMINYGLSYTTSNNPVWTYTFGETYSFDQSTHPVPESIWKPAVRFKEIIDRIFLRTGYQVNSEFFETDYFKAIYMDTFQDGQLGVTVASAVTNQNIFKIYTNSSVTYSNIQGQRDLLFNSFRGDGYDPLNNFTEAQPYNSINPGNQQTYSYFRTPFGGQYSFNIKFNYDDANVCGGNIFFQVILRKSRFADGTNSTIIASSDQFELPTCGTVASVNWFPTVNLDAGDYVKAFIQVNQNKRNNPLRILPYNSYGVRTTAPMWDLYSSPTLAGTQIVDLRLGLQDINCIDFLKALVTMFNLVIVQDEVSKTLLIEPFNWYYNEPDRVEKDWTQRLDLNSSYRVEPFTFELPKEINFQYTRGSEEYLNKIFEDTNDYPFGRYKYVSTNNLLTSDSTYELPFAATPTTVVNGADNFIIPAFYRELNNQLQPYSNKPHLFFWTGNRYAYLDKLRTQQGTWWLSSGSTQIEQTTYPCVSHLSSLDIQVPDLVSDLNFGSTWDFFGNYNPFPVQYTAYNLYNTFWEDYIDNNYSNETRRLTGRFFMRPTDVYDISLTDKIYVKDSFYRIELINEADLIDNKLTEVSMIKERGGYYKVTPPAPYYSLSGNTPYPGGLTPVQFIVCYSASTSYPVCVTGASTTTVVTFAGSPGLNPNQQVYFDYTTYYGPAPLGTFLKYTADTQTYVVINNIGEIIPYTC